MLGKKFKVYFVPLAVLLDDLSNFDLDEWRVVFVHPGVA